MIVVINLVLFSRRGCDIEGTWRPVSVTGLEAHAEALGMTGAMREQYIQSTSCKYLLEQF